MKRCLGVVLLVLVFVMGIQYFLPRQEQPETKEPACIKVDTENIDGGDAGDKNILPNDTLAEEITALSDKDSTHYSVYISYPREERKPYLYQSESMRSASMIKVFLLASTMERIKDGNLSLDMPIVLHKEDKTGGSGILSGYPDESVITLDTVLCLMITESDNTATNLLIDLLGMESINAYITRNGYSDTILSRKMMDFTAVEEGRENYTSVRDLGDLFTRIYRHECVGYEQDEIMLSYLCGQTDEECFPAALPEATIAHKTGELDSLYDDGGIIYLGDRDLIVVIMTENCSSRYGAIETMKRMVRVAAR